MPHHWQKLRVEEALLFFEQHNYTSMIIDLRANGGGLLDSVVDVSDLFFDSGTIVGTASRNPLENEEFTAQPGVVVDPDLPVIVLIDGGSASAAEILSGTLQDRGRATLVGQTTYGKGSVQQIRRIGTGGFRLTMSRYYLPSGRFIDKIGVDPDVEIVPPELSDAQSQAYTELLSSQQVIDWATDHPDPSDAEIASFVNQLMTEVDIPERWLHRLVQNEVNRQHNTIQVYDLDFDVVLQKAVQMLQEGDQQPNR